jgi:hypothetical protein
MVLRGDRHPQARLSGGGVRFGQRRGGRGAVLGRPRELGPLGGGRVEAVAFEATTGWRWVWRELVAYGFDVRLAEPVQARELLGRRRSAKTDRLDARWLARLLAREMLPESWIPPEEIQRLRDRSRLRKALAEDRRRWAQRLHAYLLHEGWPCSRSRLLSVEGLRCAAALKLPEHARSCEAATDEETRKETCKSARAPEATRRLARVKRLGLVSPQSTFLGLILPRRQQPTRPPPQQPSAPRLRASRPRRALSQSRRQPRPLQSLKSHARSRT